VAAPLAVPHEIANRDLWCMIAASALLAPFVLMNRRICRRTGAGFLAIYFGYIYFTLVG